jgi:hypothetical protein
MKIQRDTLHTSIFLGLVLVGTGCPLDPKTVGEESGANDGDGDGESEGHSASASADDDDGDDDDDDDDGSTGSDGSDDDGSDDDDDGGSDDGAWDDCEGKVCGTYCYPCDPEDPECGLPGTMTVCTPEGTCEAWGEWDVDPCPGSGVESGVETTLTNIGGCADMFVYATDSDVTVALRLYVQGIVLEAITSGAPVVREYAADDPELLLELTTGTNLLELTCNDAIENRPVIDELWRPREWEGSGPGTVSITVALVATEQGSVPLADITLTGVNFGRVDFDGLDPDIVVEELVIEDVNVNFIPG